MNRLFVHESRNQSSLNRLLTKSPLDLGVLNKQRLTMLADVSGTRMKPTKTLKCQILFPGSQICLISGKLVLDLELLIRIVLYTSHPKMVATYRVILLNVLLCTEIASPAC
ncbi:MAG: hypothetical protein ACOYYU_14890 [Chloroflexota bacterium]